MQPLSFDISETAKLFNEKKIMDLRGIANRLMREAALRNDYGKAELGVIAYALHKIETKSHFIRSPQWGKIKQAIISHLYEGAEAAKHENGTELMDSLKKIIIDIRKIDDELGNYAQNIYDKSKVKQASLAYSYGLSISQSAALTGADQKELQSYIGFTTMHDEETEVKSIGER
ncbi:MAG: hypothetical protein WCI04_04950, partial [archaeon]